MRVGPFDLDVRRFILTRGGEPVALSPRLVEILAYLAERPGALVTKDQLLDQFWPDVHVTENTLTRAIADIRKVLDDDAVTPTFIQTVARRGYRFVAAAGAGEALTDTDPFMAWTRGRMTLEALDVTRLDEAIAAFERAVAGAPTHAPAYAGLANAELLQFERTCLHNRPNRAALDRARVHAQHAATLDPSLGEAWAVMGYIHARGGESDEARAALRRAIALEGSNWRHHYRLAFASWGEERLRAVDRTLALLPGFPPAHFLAATVYVARQAFGPAEDAATRGADGQHRQTDDAAARFPAAGLHWMRGLVALGRDEVAQALQHFASEIAEAGPERVYGQEFLVNALVAEAFTRLGQGEAGVPADRFRDALAIAPGHARATLGLAIASAREQRTPIVLDLDSLMRELQEGGKHSDASLLSIAARAWRDQKTDAVLDLLRLVDDTAPGSTGWSIAVDPMLRPLLDAPGIDRVLARLASHAA